MRTIIHTRIVMALLVIMRLPEASGAEPGIQRIENDAVRLEIDREHGTFLRFLDKAGGMELTPPRELAENFRLVIPTTADPRNQLLGRKQQLSGMSLDGPTLSLEWKRPLVDEHGTPHNIDVFMRVSLKSAGIEVHCSLQNDSNETVEEVSYPLIGGVLGMDGKDSGAKVALMPPPHDAKPFARPFGEYAVEYPGNNMSYVDLTATAHKRGLYFGAHDPIARYKLFRFIEAGGKTDSEVFAGLCHLPLAKPGQRFEGAPVLLQFHDGDWVAAGKQFYRPWFIDTFGLKTKDKDWIRRQGFFQMIMIMLPEGNINYRIDEIPQLARDGLKYGVTSLQIAGWQRGGHDNGYPYYEPDPRLGTWEDLERAIAECHQMGVNVYFFANITVVNLDTEWYKTELKDCGWESANGADYWIAGWGMGTLASRMGHTTPLMGFYDTSFPAMHDGHLKYFKKLAEIGADGLHLDKTFPGNMNFNPRDTLPPDTALNEGAIRLSRDIIEQCQAIHPGFSISFECNLDRFLSFGAATWWAGNMTKAKEVFPELTETIGLYQPYDYFTLNEAVRNGYVIMISPHHFNRSMAYPTWQGLSEYIAEVKKIRDELADIVFYGEQISTDKGILFEKPLPPGVAIQNYSSIPAAKRGCILTNSGAKPAEVQLKEFAGDGGKTCKVYVPGAGSQVMALPTTITIAPERLVMIVQAGDTGNEGTDPNDAKIRQDETLWSAPAERSGDGALANNSRKIIQSAVAASLCRRTPNNADALVLVPFGSVPLFSDDFESGNLSQWTADANWRVDDNSAGGWYSGWQGKGFAWSGQGGENQTGKLRSKNFVLERDGVEVWIAGWADIQGQTADRWNYVTLNLADGAELDRVYAPNTTVFAQRFLRGKGNQGKEVYIEAVDDAKEGAYSMICLDSIVQCDGPKPLPVPKYSRTHGVRLENDCYRVEVSRPNGVITRLLDKKAGVDFIREPRLAGNFKFTLPIRGAAAWQATEANYVLGEQQALSAVKRERDALELTWRGPLTSALNHTYDADVTLRIALIEDRIQFTLAVDNRTDLEIGELFYPMLGGTIGLVPNSSKYFVDPKQTVMVVPGRTGPLSAMVFQNFVNQSWLGILQPEQHYGYPDQLCMSWLDFYQKDIDRGLYIGAIDPVSRYKVIHAEMFPGSSGPRSTGNWPTPEELGDRPAGLRVSLAHMPYSPPHTKFEAAPVIVKAHAGDWRTAARLHGTLASIEIGAAAPALLLECDGHDWAGLPGQAKQAVDAGLTGILVKNWRTIPDNAGEPLFALPEEPAQRNALRAALEQCHTLGAKVILSIAIEHASQLRPSYERLRDFASMDRWGVLDTAAGWNPAITRAQSLAGVERRVALNPGAPAYRAILAEQTAALAAVGADGLHIARFFGRTLDFNPKTEITPDRAAWEGGLNTLAALREAGRKHNPGFQILTDDSFDGLGARVDACGGGFAEHAPTETAYPKWRKMIRLSEPAKAEAIDGTDLTRTTVVLAPTAGAAAFADAEWKTLIQRLQAGMKK